MRIIIFYGFCHIANKMQSGFPVRLQLFRYFCMQIAKDMRQILTLLTVCLLLGCTSGGDGGRWLLQGAWTLRQMDYPIGRIETYAETEGTFLRFYCGDSVVYQCAMTRTATGLIVRHSLQRRVTLIDKGGGEHVYLEDDDPMPLMIADDTTIIIQRNGILSTWHRADDIADEWGKEIREIIATDLQKDHPADAQSYVLSAKERRQHSYIQWLVTAIGLITILAVTNFVVSRRRRQRLQLQLQQIQEVQQERPQAVRQAIASVETAFFASDEYQALQRRIATGQLLKEDDWRDIETQIKKAYPGFGSQLRGLHAMSELEYQVCLLVKLRIAPTDIAAVLARDGSTISTVRSRLYKKVFGQKGGAKDWDEFLLSIGA